MTDRIELARRVFAEFQKHHAKARSPRTQWWLDFNGDDRIDGLTEENVDMGLAVLLQKNLVEYMSSDGVQLTEDGGEACLHPELLDEYLAPRRNAALVSQDFTFNAQEINNLQAGGKGNTMTVNYSAVLQKLEESIRAAPLPEIEKRGLLAAVNTLLAHPLTQTIIGAGAAVGAAYAGK